MKEKICQNCTYYVQHFRRTERGYRKVGCGHCINTFNNGRFRKTNRICEHYYEREKAEAKTAPCPIV